MATTIQNLHSLTAGNQPGDLMPGEVAYNLADGYVYLGNGSNAFTDTLGQQVGTPTADGMGWQQAIFNAAPINGSVTLAGIYDAQDNLVTSTTAAGDAVGFTVGAALPAAAPGNEGYYVLVQIGGTLAPPAPTGDAQAGDWLVSSGTGWSLVAESSVVIPATNVEINPTGDFTGPTMQDVLTQIQLLYVSMADGTMSQLNCNGDAQVFGNSTLGDAASDTLTVNATSTFAAPITAQGIDCGAVTATNLYSSGNLMAVGDATIQGNVTLNADATTSVTVNGDLDLKEDLTVGGVSQLNGATQINGALTTTDAVSLTGSAGITLGTNISTTGAVGIMLGQSVDLGVNGNTDFYSNSSTTISGNLNLAQGNFPGKQITYARPLSTNGAIVNEPLPNFLVVPGTIIAFGGTTAPAGYLPCDGRILQNGGIYAALFDAIGYTWGGSGSNFVVPDLRGMFLRGTGTNDTRKNSTGGAVTGQAVGAFVMDGFASHSHNILKSTGESAPSSWSNLMDSINQGGQSGLTSGGNVNYGKVVVGNTGGGETRPTCMGVLYCIKY